MGKVPLLPALFTAFSPEADTAGGRVEMRGRVPKAFLNVPKDPADWNRARAPGASLLTPSWQVETALTPTLPQNTHFKHSSQPELFTCLSPGLLQSAQPRC